MKVVIEQDEYWPVYEPVRFGGMYPEVVSTMTEDEWADYTRVQAEWRQWQDALELAYKAARGEG
jgi:hypothetical protein